MTQVKPSRRNSDHAIGAVAALPFQASYDKTAEKDGHKGFYDWRHEDTGALVLKAQHPEFEMWNQGIHARSGVACADCRMPYIRVGAQKISDHHVRSQLLNPTAHARRATSGARRS